MKVQGVTQRKNTRRTPPDHDFLKYWRVIRFWAQKKYDLSYPDLEMMFFLYSEQIFNKSKFKDYEELMSWDRVRFSRLLKNKWIQVWRKRQGNQTTLYELSYKGKRAINNIYKKLNGEEISELEFSNPLFHSDPSYVEKINRNMIKKINIETKNATNIVR
tara:strand:+ start:270 stop:749 length:480 start_codon:yes stop_codon:yes gene_type:complete